MVVMVLLCMVLSVHNISNPTIAKQRLMSNMSDTEGWVCVFVGVCVCVCALLWLAMSHVLVTPFLEDRTAALQTAGPAGTETDRAVSSQRRLKFLNAAPFVYY